MFNSIKPYLGPAALFGLDISMNAAGFQISDFWSSVLIAFAFFWLFFTLASHKALIKKYPGIKEWLPFVDPAGGIRANSKELTGNYISNQSFNIADLAYNGLIEGRTFENCQIYGPAILMTGGVVGFMHECRFEGHPNALVIETSNKVLIGIISIKNCTFRRCVLRQIGIIGGKKLREDLPQEVKTTPNTDTQA